MSNLLVPLDSCNRCIISIFQYKCSKRDLEVVDRKEEIEGVVKSDMLTKAPFELCRSTTVPLRYTLDQSSQVNYGRVQISQQTRIISFRHTCKYAPIVQLVARQLCSLKVIGSNPVP